jgi:hypothetical protein
MRCVSRENKLDDSGARKNKVLGKLPFSRNHVGDDGQERVMPKAR